MKESLSSLELHHLARELEKLVGSRLDKAYQGGKEDKRDLTLQFHQVKAGKQLLRVKLPGVLYHASEKPRYPTMPGPFARFLRKHVGNARLTSIAQQGFERILELGFEKKNGTFTLVLELLPPGNALLLNADGKIINLLEPQRHGQRLLRGGALYKAPPTTFNTNTASIEAIVERLRTSKKDAVVKALAADLGLGNAYAEETCKRAGIAKERDDLKNAELEKIAVTVQALFDEKIKAFTTNEETAYPFAMQTKEAIVQYKTFSEAIEHVVGLDEAESDEATENATTTRKKARKEDVAAKQAAMQAGYEKASVEQQRKGELLYEHYSEIEELLQAVNEERKANGWSGVKKKKFTFKGKALRIDEAKGTITIDIAEEA